MSWKNIFIMNRKKTRSCPHCKKTINAEEVRCPLCKHMIHFEGLDGAAHSSRRKNSGSSVKK